MIVKDDVSGNDWSIISVTKIPLESITSLSEGLSLYRGHLINQGLMWPGTWCGRPSWHAVTPHTWHTSPDVVRE